MQPDREVLLPGRQALLQKRLLPVSTSSLARRLGRCFPAGPSQPASDQRSAWPRRPALGAAFGEGQPSPRGRGVGVPPLGQLARAGRRGCGLLSPRKLWVRAWLHVPGKKQSELASEREAPPGLEGGRTASEGVAPRPIFPLADVFSNCILPASPVDSSSRLSLEARAKLRPTTFSIPPTPQKSWREPRSLWRGASSHLQGQRLGRARARGPILHGPGSS